MIVKGASAITLGGVGLTAAGSAVGGAITAKGPITASADRTIKPMPVPAGSGSSTDPSVPTTADRWRAPFDPSDRAPFAIDWSGLLNSGEMIASIQKITMSAAGAALGVEIDTSTGRAPIIDEAGGKITQCWFLVDPAFQADPAFQNGGVQIGLSVLVRTDSDPFKEYERTGVLQVEQL